MMTLDQHDPIVMADTGPLIRLAAAGVLNGLRATNRRIVIVDRVVAEATGDLTKPYAREIAEWIERNSDAIERPRTLTGLAIEQLEAGPRNAEEQRLLKATIRNSGEKAIREFLETWVPGTPGALVVFEDMPFALQTTRVPLVLMTTRRFARQLADWGVNVDAVAAEVAKRFNTRAALLGSVDPEESIDFRVLPQPDP
jgi:hypothetical protein